MRKQRKVEKGRMSDTVNRRLPFSSIWFQVVAPRVYVLPSGSHHSSETNRKESDSISFSTLSTLALLYICAHFHVVPLYSIRIIYSFISPFFFLRSSSNEPAIHQRQRNPPYTQSAVPQIPPCISNPVSPVTQFTDGTKEKKNPSFWERVLTLSGRSDWYHQINKTHGGKICNWVQKFRYAKTISGLKENSNHRWGFNRTNIFLSSYSDNPELNLINILAGKWRNSITPSLCALCSPVAFSYCSLFII